MRSIKNVMSTLMLIIEVRGIFFDSLFDVQPVPGRRDPFEVIRDLCVDRRAGFGATFDAENVPIQVSFINEAAASQTRFSDISC